MGAAAEDGDRFTPTTTQVILETLTGAGRPGGGTAPVEPGASVTFDATDFAGKAAGLVTVAALNINARRPTANGYLTAYSSEEEDPNISSVNFAAGGETTNGFDLVIPSSEGKVTITNHSAGTVHVQVSTRGYFAESAAVIEYSDVPEIAWHWTIDEAVERLHRMCRSERLGARGLDRRSWIGWEAGGRPSWDYQDLLSRLFRTSPIRLGWAADDTPVSQQWPVPYDPYGAAEEIRSRWPTTDLSPGIPSLGGDWNLHLPGGTTMPGAATAVGVHRLDARLQLGIRDPRLIRRLAETPRRGLLLGVRESNDAIRLFALNARAALRAIGSRRTQICLPPAYELDDLTFGVLWATANLEDALLFDDVIISESLPRLLAYDRLDSSSVSRAAASELTTTSQGWIGSEFCARHILRHLDTLQEVPVFWTREQRGEEACTWLLYRHKYDYLREISDRYRVGPLARAFCVPEDVVTDSPAYERILLFLAVALMESLGIRTWICVDDRYTDVDGFVLDGRREAIVATWVRTAGIWHVDANDHAPTVREFEDAAHVARVSSIIEAALPEQRLAALADYLGLDIAWLSRRCRGLAQQGWGRLARPQSRLLSLDGLDAACAFVGRFAVPSRAAG